jgi:hypothetical protein
MVGRPVEVRSMVLAAREENLIGRLLWRVSC